MPTLQINKCEDCPFHKVEREDWMDDCYRIFCEHEEQTSSEGYTTKINRGGGIHFNCPLDKKDHSDTVECTCCGLFVVPENGGTDDYWCPNCTALF